MGIRTYLSKDFDPESLSVTLASLKYPIVGVDEVGRGCLAGPVYAAAVCFKSIDGAEPVLPPGMTDSKLLSEKRRLEISEFIQKHHHFGIGIATVEEVDELNILQASFVAMQRALEKLEKSMKCASGVVLVDGHMKIRNYRGEQIPVVKGDLRVPMIAAASVVAKVARDEMMKSLDQDFPEFGFGKHKGYGSAAHRKVIAERGPSIWHRRSFSGVKEFL